MRWVEDLVWWVRWQIEKSEKANCEKGDGLWKENRAECSKKNEERKVTFWLFSYRLRLWKTVSYVKKSIGGGFIKEMTFPYNDYRKEKRSCVPNNWLLLKKIIYIAWKYIHKHIHVFLQRKVIYFCTFILILNLDFIHLATED